MRWWWLEAALLAAVLQACSTTRPLTPPVVGGHQEGIASWYGPGFHGKRTANGEVYDQYELTAAHQTLPLGTRAMVTSLANGRAVEVRINDRGPFIGGRIVDLSYAAASVIGMVGPGTMPVRLDVLDTPIQVASRRVVPRPRAPRPAPEPPPPAPASRAAEPALPPAGAPEAEPEPSPIARATAREPYPPARATAPERRPAVPAVEEPAGTYAVLVATLSDAGRAEHLRSRIALKFADAHVRRIDVGADRYYRVRIGPYPSRGVALARAELVNRFGYPAVITDESEP